MDGRVVEHLNSAKPRIERELFEFLRIPSVSADPANVAAMKSAAGFLQLQFCSLGCETNIVPTPGHDIAWARLHSTQADKTVTSRKRVLIYGHYDVQPADPLDLWTTPPFEPSVRDGKVFARGATDDKGQLFTHLKAVEAWIRTVGELPVDIDFVIEGEEEVGSENLDAFLEAHANELRPDVAVISDTSQYAPGIPAITTGLRGLVACEFTVRGPKKDLHSGVFGGSLANPLIGLSKILAKLHDDQGRVQIPGFYDDVVELTVEDRAGFASLPFDEAAYLAEIGAAAPFGEAGFTTLERRWARPTCEINGMFGGYTGPGPKTIVPASATAKVTCRLVAAQDPQKIVASLERFIRANLLPGLTVEIKTYPGNPAFLLDSTSPYLNAAGNAIEAAFGARPVLIREGGSIPVVGTFKRLLGVDTLLLGWGQNTDNLHSPDEHFSLEDFHRGTLASACLIDELGRMA